MKNREINRRRVLKSIGATVSGTSLSSGSSKGEISERQYPSDKIYEKTQLSDVLVTDGDLSSSLTTHLPKSNNSGLDSKRTAISELVQYMETDTGLTASRTENMTVELQGESNEFNTYDPAIEIIPFGNRIDFSSFFPVYEDQAANGSRQGSGLLYIFSVVEDDDRVPVGVLGMTAQRQVDHSDDGRFDRRMYVLNDGVPERQQQETVEGPEPVAGLGMGWVACHSCQVLADAVCAGGVRVLSKWPCVGACTTAFGANFIAAFGCANICVTMFTAIGAVGCSAGAGRICSKMSNLAPWYISFC